MYVIIPGGAPPESGRHPCMYMDIVQFCSLHFDLITQEMLHLQYRGGFHAGPGLAW